MTLEEFITKLGKTDRDWSLRRKFELDSIRRGTFEHPVCPITAVCKQVTGEVYRTVCWKGAAYRLGLSEDLAIAVVKAADIDLGYDKELRQKLLVAVGLKERK